MPLRGHGAFHHWKVRMSKQRKRKSVFSTDLKTLGAIGEDFRKVATVGISAGIIGLIVSGNVITSDEALLVIGISLALWVQGVRFTEKSNSTGENT